MNGEDDQEREEMGEEEEETAAAAGLAGAEAGGGVVATHEGEAGVRRAEREEEEVTDPLGLHGGDAPCLTRLGPVGEIDPALGLHRRRPPVGGRDRLRNLGGFRGKNWEGAGGWR